MKTEGRRQSDNTVYSCLGKSVGLDSPEAEAALRCQAEVENIRQGFVSTVKSHDPEGTWKHALMVFGNNQKTADIESMRAAGIDVEGGSGILSKSGGDGKPLKGDDGKKSNEAGEPADAAGKMGAKAEDAVQELDFCSIYDQKGPHGETMYPFNEMASNPKPEPAVSSFNPGAESDSFDQRVENLKLYTNSYVGEVNNGAASSSSSSSSSSSGKA
jgi:hypothetical protein